MHARAREVNVVMALSMGEIIEISLRQVWLGQEVMQVFQYEVGSPPVPAESQHVGEAWWNHVKTAYRACCPTIAGEVFQSVLLKSLSFPQGDYGEFAIPTGERAGTRTVTGQIDLLPPFNAIGMRLTVGSRLTRPGQKRFAFLVEGDQNAGQFGGSLYGLVQTLGNVLTEPMLLGAPAATTNLLPVVVRKTANGTPSVHQGVTGYLVNTRITTQNSRKIGKGS